MVEKIENELLHSRAVAKNMLQPTMKLIGKTLKDISRGLIGFWPSDIFEYSIVTMTAIAVNVTRLKAARALER